jgi:hypothetical protein
MKIRHFKFKYDIIRPLQIFFRGYSYADWWDAFSILSRRMLPVMKMFRDKHKHGIPCSIQDEEKDRFIAMGYEWSDDTMSFSDKVIDGKTAYERASEIWQKIIDEIYFALDHAAYEKDDDCQVPNPLYNPNQKEFFHSEPIEGSDASTMIFHDDYGKTKLDMDLYRAKEERVQKGLELMGKYWRNLWD